MQSSSNYFSLFQEVYIKNKQWRRLIGSIFSECEIHLIASEVCESLKNPILPVPVLRRESRNYSTIIQDLLGNSLAEPVEAFYMPSPAENIMKGLFDCEEGLLREISEDRNRSYLIQSRWLIRKDKRPTTTSQALQRNKDIESMYLLHMLRVLKGTIRSHCKAVLAKLEKINELKTFLSEYCINVIFYLVGGLFSFYQQY